MVDGYTPSFAPGLANPNVSGALPETETGGGSVPWEAAPATSHILRWRWYDAKQHKFLTKFPGATGQGRSELHVQFKDKQGGASSVYAYYFATPEAGATVVQKLRSSSHPYGEVLTPYVIRAGIPYTKVHG